MLDIGAQTLLVPMVESGAQAAELVRATRYPPHGNRGLGAALASASQFNRIPDYLQTAQDEPCLLLQVESRAGLEALDDIATTEGVDRVFIGPADLAALRIQRHGKAAGILTADTKLARHYLDLGASFVAVGSDVGLLAGAAGGLAAEFKAVEPGMQSGEAGQVYSPPKRVRRGPNMAAIAVVAMGQMGAGLAARLTSCGARVFTSPAGRSAASHERARDAGAEAVDDAELVRRAGIILSVMPPARAAETAERFPSAMTGEGARPINVDCNAVASGTVRAIAAPFADAGVSFVDGSIIGAPPRGDAPGPRVYLRGDAAGAAELLAEHGLDAWTWRGRSATPLR